MGSFKYTVTEGPIILPAVSVPGRLFYAELTGSEIKGMIHSFDESGSIEGLRKALAVVEAEEGVSAFFVLCAVGNGFSAEELDPLIRESSRPIFGGIFPGVLYQNRMYEKGTVVLGLRGDPAIGFLSLDSDDVETRIDTLFRELPESGATMLVFVDAFISMMSSFIDSIYNVFGLGLNYLGGGTGDFSNPEAASVITPEGLKRHAAVFALLPCRSGIGVRHGWRSVDGPFKVTQASGGRIISLDWEPAAEVYSRIIREHSGETISESNFFNLAAAYPFGIGKIGAEMVVRDPMRMDPDGSVVCVGGVPEGCFVDILHGDRDSLVASSMRVRDDAAAGLEGIRKTSPAIVMDCVSRYLFLKDRFQDEMDAICGDSTLTVGALSTGEIANSGTSFLEFFNKTVVVGILEEK